MLPLPEDSQRVSSNCHFGKMDLYAAEHTAQAIVQIAGQPLSFPLFSIEQGIGDRNPLLLL